MLDNGGRSITFSSHISREEVLLFSTFFLSRNQEISDYTLRCNDCFCNVKW